MECYTRRLFSDFVACDKHHCGILAVKQPYFILSIKQQKRFGRLIDVFTGNNTWGQTSKGGSSVMPEAILQIIPGYECDSDIQ